MQSEKNVPGTAQKVVDITEILSAVPGTFPDIHTFNR